MSVVRDSAWVEREYGQEKWPAIRRHIEELRSAGETSLSRIMAQVIRWDWAKPPLEPHGFCVDGVQYRLPTAFGLNGMYAMIAETVIAACRPETDAIIDLGGGWGRVLFDVWLRGGPRGIPYYILEYTQAGRDCAETLGRLEPDLILKAAPFDFTKPDLSVLPAGLRHAVVLSVWAAHQIPLLDGPSYKALFSLAQQIDCLHFEPIGFQMDPDDASSLGRAHAERNDYNRNLWPLLVELERAGDITVEPVYRDLAGVRADYPMSLVHWRR